MENRNTLLTPHAHRFATHWGFILASVGSVVGMANVQGFPYGIGNNGGGTFLLIHIFFALLFTYVGLPTGFANGRRVRTGTLGTYRAARATRGDTTRKIDTALGWLPLAGSLYIAIGYTVTVAYVTKALFDSVTGGLMGASTEKWFESFALQGFLVVPFHVTVMIGTLATLLLGVKGIEKTDHIMMPVFFMIFAILTVQVVFLPDVAQGYLFMLTPHQGTLVNPTAWVWTMSRAFFSSSITESDVIVHGAYLPDDEDVVEASQCAGFFNTLAAMVAALVIIPTCFAFQTDVGAGPGLLFVTLPAILQSIPLGQLFAVILYVAMIFVGVSSLQDMFEAMGESLLHRLPRFNHPAVLVALYVLALGAGLGIEAITSWGPWTDLVSVYIIPTGASLGAITWLWVMRCEKLFRAINIGTTRPRGKFWLAVGRFVYVPVTVVLCVIALLGHIAFWLFPSVFTLVTVLAFSRIHEALSAIPPF